MTRHSVSLSYASISQSQRYFILNPTLNLFWTKASALYLTFYQDLNFQSKTFLLVKNFKFKSPYKRVQHEIFLQKLIKGYKAMLAELNGLDG